MLCSVECFENTGFNSVDVPESSDLLRKYITPKSFPAVWVLQDRDIPQIKIATKYDNIKNVDYCFIGSTYYFVTAITMINENTCQLSLKTDYLTTLGIPNLNIVSGWCTRRHVINDELFKYQIEEPFTPSNNLELDTGTPLIDLSNEETGFIYVVGSTVLLTGLGYEAKTFSDSTTANNVTVPLLQPVYSGSIFILNDRVKQNAFNYAGIALYNHENNLIKDAISVIRSLGVESAIQFSYSLPKALCISNEGVGGNITALEGKFIDNIEVDLPYIYNSTIKNKKAFSGQFQKYTLYSIASGSSMEYIPEDIITDSTEDKPKFIVFSDPQPTGKPYARPKTFNNDTDNLFLQCVEGATWQNSAVIYTGASGQSLKDIQYNRQSSRAFWSMAGQQAVNIGSPALDILTGGTSGSIAKKVPLNRSGMDLDSATQMTPFLNVGSTAYNYLMDATDRTKDYNIAKFLTVPELHFTPSDNLQGYFNNGFWVSRTRLANDDLVKFDNFLTQFGYAVFEPLTLECFTGRKYFNYIEANSINIKNNIPMYARIGVINQLNKGVRVWHVLPDIQYMYDNPIA